jgi:hypothetical protein
MKHILFIVPIIILRFSCQHKSIEIESNLILPTDTLVKTTSYNQTEIDTIVYDSITYPIFNELKSKVLTEGEFHNDEVWSSAKKENWFGLFYNSEEVYVDTTKISVKSVYDLILDDENGKKTGWKVTAKHIDTTILLIQNENIAPLRNIKQIKYNKQYLYPDDSFSFEYQGQKYVLYAKGGKKKEQPNSDWYTVWNYKLYLKTIVNNEIKESLLCAEANFSDQMISIDFIGDIDGDKIPDLIINTSRHYNASCPTLYLSKPAKGKNLVKPIGFHESIGC